MQVTYATTLEDYVAFNRHVARKSVAVWVVFLLGCLTIPAIAVVVAIPLMMKHGWPVVLVVALIGLFGAIMFALMQRVLFDAFIRAYAKRLGTRGVIGQITLILTDESLVEITEVTRTESRWEDIKGVEVAGDYTFIFVTGLSAAILPRHGFDYNEDYEAVRDFALARVGHAA